MVSNKPPILPVNPTLYNTASGCALLLRHSVFAFILMHSAAMILHKLVKSETVHGRECSWLDHSWVFTESGIVGIVHPT